ncbi:nicotinic acid mononucleotide adenyltransferase [Nonlabens xiamenensis]|uniref:nicotinic acid mononucleotide adenyltransferase n=1 Tax=Nonlabens xiamenensis TaxID=2341043 RepID=UPI000F60D8F8|nr:nicotinic acid mononucleotide adenyltransferase [Nonlabens xiamenensis]
MKKFTTLLGGLVLATSLISCEADIIIGEPIPAASLNEVLLSKEIWYVDLNATQGTPNTPFMTKAFTLSFDFGTLYANNNLVGVGSAGAGFGLDVGTYETVGDQLAIYHDLDGLHDFRVIVRNYDRLELRDIHTGTRYFLDGYDRDSFDYDQLFYDNIQYFLQEYLAWEKISTSQTGALNEFDNENYLRFIPGNIEDTFESSKDRNGLSPGNIYWDFSGTYLVEDQTPGSINKQLTLGYDFLGNDFFDLYILDDRTIELYHSASGTTYLFKGRGYIALKNSVENGKDRMLDFKRSKK